MRAVVFGETIWDVYPNERVIGGAPFNFSAHLARLGDEAYFMTAVGADEPGDKAMAEAARFGIKTCLIQRNRYNTGACLVTLDEKGSPSYNVLSDTAYDHITVPDALIVKINGLKADMFYFNTLIQRTEESRLSLKRVLENCGFPEIFCDVNLRKDCFDRNSLELCMKKATIVKISEEEGHYLYDLGLLRDSGRGLPRDATESFPNLKLVLYTLGEDGSLVYDCASGKLYGSGKPPKVEVVSTVGAGDYYGAAFVSVYLNGGSIAEAIRTATERSSIVVTHKEAVPF
jgi:fructokinase